MTIDLTYLKHRESVERKRAEWGSCDESRKAHQGLADQYADKIRALGGEKPDPA